MKVAVFDSHSYERNAFQLANERFAHELTFFEPRLASATANRRVWT